MVTLDVGGRQGSAYARTRTHEHTITSSMKCISRQRVTRAPPSTRRYPISQTHGAIMHPYSNHRFRTPTHHTASPTCILRYTPYAASASSRTERVTGTDNVCIRCSAQVRTQRKPCVCTYVHMLYAVESRELLFAIGAGIREGGVFWCVPSFVSSFLPSPRSSLPLLHSRVVRRRSSLIVPHCFSSILCSGTAQLRRIHPSMPSSSCNPPLPPPPAIPLPEALLPRRSEL